MTPVFIRRNFKSIDIPGLKKIVLQKNDNKDKRFLYESFKEFVPLSIKLPGLNESVENKVEVTVSYKMYYRVVKLNDYDFFIGIFHNLDKDSIYVFNCKSTNDDLGCKVTMSSIFRNSKLFTIKVLLNRIANSLEL